MSMTTDDYRAVHELTAKAAKMLQRAMRIADGKGSGLSRDCLRRAFDETKRAAEFVQPLAELKP